MVSISKDVWSPLARKVGKFVIKHAPQLAGYVGVGGFLVAIGLTYKNAADIHEAVETKDYKTVAKKTLPIAVTTAGSIVAIHFACRESEKRLAAALLANNLSTAAYNDLKDSMEVGLSEKKIKEVEHKGNESRVEKALNKIENPEKLECVGTGQILVMEKLTGKIFRGDVVTIERAVNEVNKEINRSGDLATLAELHYAMGLDDTSDMDSLVCWHPDHSDVQIEWDLPTELHDRTPVAVLVYRRYGILDPYSEFRALD